MAEAQSNEAVACIYCGTQVDILRGDGDHVVPAALGRFEGELKFRRICQPCNNSLSPCEQQLLWCGPESLARAIINPVTKDKRKKRGARSAKGKRPEMFVVDENGQAERVVPDMQNPGHVQSPDQLVVLDRDGQPRTVPLFPEMTAASIRKRIEALGVELPVDLQLRVDERYKDHYLALLKSASPNMQYADQGGRSAGAHQTQVYIRCEINEQYYRALAKIAFHYFLVTSTRGFQGDEPEFEPIRRFIMLGGDHREFFDRPEIRFRLPEHEAPKNWVHFLAATEEDGRAVALVALFVGPRNQPLPHHVSLGRLRSPIIFPGAHSFHEYAYSATLNEGRFAGKVLKRHLVRVK